MHLWYVFATNLRFELWSWDKSSRKVPSTFLVFRTSLVRWCATQKFFGNWESRVIVVFAPWDYEAHSEIVSEKVCPDLIFEKNWGWICKMQSPDQLCLVTHLEVHEMVIMIMVLLLKLCAQWCCCYWESQVRLVIVLWSLFLSWRE